MRLDSRIDLAPVSPFRSKGRIESPSVARESHKLLNLQMFSRLDFTAERPNLKKIPC